MEDKRTAIYCRVSTTDQTTDNQRLELERYCERRGWTIAEVYEDIGISGACDSRPQLDGLMADARRRRFDVVAVWKFDRFARSTTHLLRALDEFRDMGIDFVSVTEAIDTSTPMGKMVFTVIGAMAAFERELIAERVKSGLARAKAQGVRLGRPRVGFDFGKAVELRQQGWGFKRIADELGVPRTTVYRHLKGIPQTPAAGVC